MNDESANSELLIDFLDTRFKDKTDIEIAYNGEQAMEMIEKSPQSDCVLLDIEMPVKVSLTPPKKSGFSEVTHNF